MIHQLKTLPEYFKHSWAGWKTFEIRANDRKFEVGDEVVLSETIEGTDDRYMNRTIKGIITYLTDFKQQDGYVVFSYKEIGRWPSNG
jgi:hypothetical protein